MTAFDYVMSNGGAGYDGAGPSSQQSQQEQQEEQQQQQPPSAAAGASNASSIEVGVLPTCHCAWLSAAAACNSSPLPCVLTTCRRWQLATPSPNAARLSCACCVPWCIRLMGTE